MIRIDGKPALLLGLYENPTDDRRLAEAVRAGFNLVQCSGDRAALDRVRAAGARAWVNLGEDLDLSADRARREEQLSARVRLLKDHPALLLWEGPDEALWNASYSPSQTLYEVVLPAMARAAEAAADPASARERVRRAEAWLGRGLPDRFQAEREAFWKAVGGTDPRPEARIDDWAERASRSAAGYAEGRQAVRKLDRAHPVWLNHAPRNSLAALKQFGRAADAVGCDIYPVPPNFAVGHSDLPDLTLASVGAYTDRMRASAPGKPCLMVLQGFGWRDLQKPDARDKEPRIGRRPGWDETRFMAYDALLHGAAGVLYWGTPYALDGEGEAATLDTELWRDLLRIARELRALEPAFTSPEPVPVTRLTVEENPSSADGLRFAHLLRRAGSDWVLMVANEQPQGRAFRVTGLPAELDGRVLYRLGTPETVTVQGGAVRDGVRAFDVHVYATSRRFEAAP